MGKAQANFFVIIGIILVIMVATFFTLKASDGSNVIKDGNNDISDASFVSLQSYFDDCTKSAVIKANLEIGMNENSKGAYESYLNLNIKNCMLGPYEDLRKQGYDFTDAQTYTNIEYGDNTLTIKVNYPIEVEKNNKKFVLVPIEFTFDKGQFENLEENQELSIVSSDNRANIKIPEGTKVEFEDGTLIDSVGIKVIEKNFDGLNNGIVVGNLVYEGLPDGATFSKPVEITLIYRSTDIPSGFTEDYLQIAYFDEAKRVWRGLETETRNGIAKAHIRHFTKFAIVIGCGEEQSIRTPYLFQQKYSNIKNVVNNGVIESIIVNGEDFCSDGFEPLEEGFVPTKENYYTYLENLNTNIPATDGMHLTVPQLEGTYTYGDNPSECEVFEEMPGCCDLDGKIYVSSKQDCYEGEFKEECEGIELEMIEGIISDEPAELNRDTKILLEQFTGDFEDFIVGYSNRNCIGGKAEGVNGNPLLQMPMIKEPGITCIDDEDLTNIENIEFNTAILGTIGICTASELYFDEESELTLNLDMVTVDEPSSGYCASCIGELKIKGVNINNGFITCEENEFGKTRFILDGATPVCKKCDEMTEYGSGIFGYSTEVDTSECDCTATMEGTAWCDYRGLGAKICLNGKLEEWTEENDPEDYRKYVIEGGCTTCTPDKFGETPCEEAVGGESI